MSSTAIQTPAQEAEFPESNFAKKLGGGNILTPAEAARATSLSESTLAKMRLRGGSANLPFVKMGKRVGYRPEDIAVWLHSRVRTSTSDRGCGMTGALLAVAKSQIASMADRLHLCEDELVHLGAALMVSHGHRAGIDRRGAQAILNDAFAARAVEGREGD